MKIGFFQHTLNLLSALPLLLKQPYSFINYNNKRIYYNNFNCIAIIEKNIKEVNQNKMEIYNNCDFFIDIGAHIGMKTILFNEVNPHVNCLAFEPNPITHKMLSRNTLANIRIAKYQRGISNKRGKTRIFFDRDHLDTASINQKHYPLLRNSKRKIESVEVPVNRLDDFYHLYTFKKNIYLKIDVESLERKVLQGAKKTLKNVKYLEIEISQKDNLYLSDIFQLINGKFNLIEADFFYDSTKYLPIATNLLFEFS